MPILVCAETVIFLFNNYMMYRLLTFYALGSVGVDS